MLSLFLWDNAYFIGAKPIPLGSAKNKKNQKLCVLRGSVVNKFLQKPF